MSTKKPLKRYLDFSEQLQLLQRRGMKINDPEKAQIILSKCNYYRLSGYWMVFFDKARRKFKEGITFEDALELYEYDFFVKEILFRHLSKIEINLRTKLGHQLGALDPLIYFDYKKMGHAARTGDAMAPAYISWLSRYDTALEKSKEPFVIHHKRHYQSQLPIWVAVEIMDWGMLSTLYMMSPQEVRNAIAEKCNLTDIQLESWLKSLNILRNVIAHQGRLFNKVFAIKPKLIAENQLWEFFAKDNANKNNRLFVFVAMIAHLNSALGLSDNKELSSIIESFPNSKVDPYTIFGMPENWYDFLFNNSFSD